MKSFSKQFFYDRTTLSLIASNLVTIVVALWQNWPLGVIMWIYWGQSVIIGVFNFFRILDLQQFSTKGFQIDGKNVEPTRGVKIQTAVFFLFHYGFFHVGYALFLAVLFSRGSSRDIFGIGICTLVFAGNHFFSFWQNRRRDRTRTPNIGTIMGFPYARIVPMHLTIIFGGWMVMAGVHARLILLLFLVLKTVADVIMHMVEHADARKRETSSEK
ncbi:MAG: hypothetical protein JXA11_16175 [Phycisphaerae bacterium]|nr:hypothetical protein [Phycisphaerae bacterium]